MFRGTFPMVPPPKPELKVELDLSVPEGHAQCFDGSGSFLAAVAYPTKPPMATRTVRVGPEVYFSIYPAQRV